MNNINNYRPLVSILINNYNYGHFLGEAIDSALEQTYPYTEVIVIDDGSTDNSQEVIASYGSQIIPVIKENGGQASAFNVGFEKCHGDIICFLDSDDIFDATKVEKCVNFITAKMVNNSLVMVYHLLDFVNKDRVPMNRQNPDHYYGYGTNLYQYACKYKFVPFAASATSGNLISRELAKRIFPIPEFRSLPTSADDFIVKAALLLGEVYRIDQVLGQYRIHGENNWAIEQKVSSHGKPKAHTKKHYIELDKYLNAKLKENNKQAVLSFFDSMRALNYYKTYGSTPDLFKLGLRVLKGYQDLTTLRFFRHMTSITIKNYVKQILPGNKKSL